MKFNIYTLGCKVNTYETNVMSDLLKNKGYIEVGLDEKIEINDFDNDKTLKMDRIDPNKKFKSTEFISPIFGVQDNDIKYPSVPKLLNKEEDIFDKLNIEKEEKIINTKRLDAEIKKNDDFLKALKEFRKNLD